MPTVPDNIGLAGSNQDLELKGDLVIRDANGIARIRLDRESGGIFIKNKNGKTIFQLEMPGQNLRFGGHGKDADLVMFRRDASGLADVSKAIMHVDTDRGVIRLGTEGTAGQIVCKDDNNEQTIFLNGQDGLVVTGANGKNGELIIQNADSKKRIRLLAENARVDIGGNNEDGEIRLRMANGKTSFRARAQGGETGPVAVLDVGGNGASGSIHIRNSDNKSIGNISPSGALVLGGDGHGPEGKILLNAQGGAIGVRLDAGGNLRAGASSTGGSINLHRATEQTNNPGAGATISAHADSGTLRVGGGIGSDTDGRVLLRDRFDNDTIKIDGENASIALGTGNLAGSINVMNRDNETSILLNGEAGDIVLQNGDVAEEFTLADNENADPGSLLVIDEDAKLRLCTETYDSRVAGIAAGFGTLRPGIVLGRRPDIPNRIALALAGRVFCKVDASKGEIKSGDLLTTSDTPGHAMKATDRHAALGAIIGKALGPLAQGQALIPVLVTMR